MAMWLICARSKGADLLQKYDTINLIAFLATCGKALRLLA